MAKYVVVVNDDVEEDTLRWWLNKLRAGTRVTLVVDDTGTRNSKKSDRRQTTRRQNEKTTARLKK